MTPCWPSVEGLVEALTGRGADAHPRKALTKVCGRTLIRASLALMGVLLGSLAAAHQGHDTKPSAAARTQVLAPGYGALSFTAPAAGSYELPPLGPAADGVLRLDDGRYMRLHDLMGDRLVLLSFVYTSCSDVNGCPLATAVLNSVARRVAADPRLAEALRLVTLSFDPLRDTPEVMARYGDPFRVDGVEWVFATSDSKEAIGPILRHYGQRVVEERDADGRSLGSFAHLLKVALIDRERRVRNVYSVSFLHPDVLINDLRTVLLEGGADEPGSDVTGPALGPGDDKRGYEGADYRSHSASLESRQGRPADLLAFASEPGLGLPPVPVPATNPLTARKVALGRKLFFDRRLSLNDTLSCAMCHIPEQGFTSNELATPVGLEGRTVRRNAPTLLNVAYLERLFHDGRETTLEQQVWSPLLASNELANPAIGTLLEKLGRIPDYEGLFEAAFDGRGPGMETVGRALASYQRTLVAADSPFDRFRYGGDSEALSESARRGLKLFLGRGRCAACHLIGERSALLTDGRYHDVGIGWKQSSVATAPSRQVQLAPGVFVEVANDLIRSAAEPRPSDLGRYEVSQNPADRWRYRTPSLRNVALTAPYMHDGSMSSLAEVVRHYNRGGFPHPEQDPLIEPLGLEVEEMADLVVFLESLSSPRVEQLVADAFAAPIGDLGPQDPHWSHQ